MTENNNPLGMKSIAEAMNVPLGQTFRQYFIDIRDLDWYFSKWWEKAGLIAMMLWCFYSIYVGVRGLF